MISIGWKGDWVRMLSLWNILWSTCVIEIWSLKWGGWRQVRAVAAHTEMSQCRFAKLQWQDTARCSWSNRTAGGTSNISWALSWDSRSRGAPVCASPPPDGWEVLCRCVYVLCRCVLARMSSTVCEWVAVHGSQRSQLAGARLRRHHRAQRSRLLRFGGGTK